MSKKRTKVILGLISLWCLGNPIQAEAAFVGTAADLAAAGGVVTTDATGAVVNGAAMGILNTGASGDFVYTNDVQINNTGYNLLQTPNKERTAIRSTTSDLTLGKTTVIWRNDSANTASDFYIYGIKTYMDSTVTLGNGSLIDIEGNTSDSIKGVYAGNNATIGPGNVVLGDQMTILVKNDGNGYVQGIDSYDGADITVGEDLYLNVSGGSSGIRGIEVGFNQATASIGANATIVSNSTGGTAIGVFAFNTGAFTAQENLNIQVDSTGAAYGIYARENGTEVNLNGATIVASQNGVAGTGYSLVSMSGATVQGNLGKYDLTGSVIANNGTIAMDFDKNSEITGASLISGTGTIDYKMDGTTWNMTDDSKLTSLTFGGDTSNVIFAGDSSFKALTVSDLSGTGGQFTMRTDIVGDGAGNNTGDLLIVTGSSAGQHGVTVQNRGASNATGEETLTIIDTVDGNAEFVLTRSVELGGYEYDLRRVTADTTNWELYGARRATSTGSASVNVFSGGYLLNYAETQTLLQRMGDLRQDSSDGGVWARAYGGKFESNSDGFLSSYDMSYSGMQVGADKKIALKNNGNIYVGGMFGYSKGNLDYGVGSGSIDSKTLGAYGTYVAPTGFYADLVLKYGWMKNDFKVLDSAGEWVTGDDMSTDGLSASLEVGQRIHFDRKKKEGWYLEPQAQISMGHQSGGSFNASNGLRVDVDSYTSTLGRLGLNAGYEVKSGKNPINVYAKVSYVHEFDGDVGYRLNGSSEQTSFGDSWWTYGVGITAQINKKHNVYLDIERASGGQFNQPWSLNGGYRFNW